MTNLTRVAHKRDSQVPFEKFGAAGKVPGRGLEMGAACPRVISHAMTINVEPFR